MKKSRRKDVIIARIIFVVLVIALIALIVFGIREFIKYRLDHKAAEENTEPTTETISTQDLVNDSEISIDENSQWVIEEENNDEEQATQLPEVEIEEPEVGTQESEVSDVETEPQITLKAMYRVNLRADSNTDAAVLGVVQKQDTVTLLEELDNGWGRVAYGEFTGYVYLEYFLMLDPEESEEAPVEVPSDENTTVDEPAEQTAGESHEGKVIVLDPGHQSSGDSVAEPNGPNSATMKARCTGGTTGVATKVPEYQLVLDVAKELQAELEKRGYTVYLTRTKHDVNISNVERAQYATSVGADITVRIHANGADDANISGALALVPSSENPYVAQLADSSSFLAKEILDGYCGQTGMKNWGVVSTDTMTGINWSTMPVAILEMGYMTNESDDKNMQDAAFQQKMVLGIADGIDAYFN